MYSYNKLANLTQPNFILKLIYCNRVRLKMKKFVMFSYFPMKYIQIKKIYKKRIIVI